MRRHPIKLALLVVLLVISCIVIYYTAQMRMRTPPQITIMRIERVPRPDVPHAYLKIHYEMKNTALFPVSVHMVSLQGPECQFGGDIAAIYPEKDALLLKPGQVHQGSFTVTLPVGESFMDAAFLIRWEPGAARRLQPLLYRIEDEKRKLLNEPPPDPFAPAGSPPPAHPPINWPQDDLLENIRIELPRSTPP
jgi:hypothetical protein